MYNITAYRLHCLLQYDVTIVSEIFFRNKMSVKREFLIFSNHVFKPIFVCIAV